MVDKQNKRHHGIILPPLRHGTSVSVGMSMNELGDFCLNELGAIDGVNQDGGGSSAIWVDGQIRNDPSDGSERTVANGLMMVSVHPKDLSTNYFGDDTVRVTNQVAVRLGPGNHFGEVSTVPEGTEGEVRGHSGAGVRAKGIYWWPVDFNGGIYGWVDEGVMELVARDPDAGLHPGADGSITTDGGTIADSSVAVDGRYLLGIVKNISQIHEGMFTAQALLRADSKITSGFGRRSIPTCCVARRLNTSMYSPSSRLVGRAPRRPRSCDLILESALKERLNAKDFLLAELQKQLEGLKRFHKSPHHLVNTLIKKALEAERFIDRTFWLSSVSDILSELPQSERKSLYGNACRRIHSAFKTPYKERCKIVSFLASKVVELL